MTKPRTKNTVAEEPKPAAPGVPGGKLPAHTVERRPRRDPGERPVRTIRVRSLFG
ncbi:hypothetical protein ACFPM3_14030 [Streptomyces coeruleoprunus]|uniref:Uncharacterized protein n=1 Tax=Streptomyces coeruleoprunus TaxID=285563 RepID=A0ABV9XCR9_9ACTN